MRSFIGVAVALLGLWASGTDGFSFSWPHLGRCPDLPVQQKFDVTGYTGTWYIQAGYNLGMSQGEGRCGSALYTYDAAHGYVKVYNKQISSRTNKWVSINGTAKLIDPSKDEGKLIVNLYIWGFLKVTGPYWVLGTDYKLYSVVYSCENFLFFFHYYSSWLLSRVRDLESAGLKNTFYEDVNKTLVYHNLNPSSFKPVDQQNCYV